MNMCINESFIDQNLTVYISPTLISSSHQGVDQWENPGKFEAKVWRGLLIECWSPLSTESRSKPVPFQTASGIG